jgi:hypothetical protein
MLSRRAKPLRDDPLTAKLAGVLKDDFAVALVILIEHDTQMWATYQFRELALEIFNRRAAQVFAIQFDQIEGNEHSGVAMSLVADQVKDGKAVAISDNRFAVDQKRAGG